MTLIRKCNETDFDAIYEIVNDAAQAYRGVIPEDRWKDPYFPREYLRHEMDAGVAFWGAEVDGSLAGIMGIQPVLDATLIRHAYVRTTLRNRGIGGALLEHLCRQTGGLLLVGTWAAAAWAIGFYQRHGFRLVSEAEKDRLLRRYWSIPERQIETSVVLMRQVPSGAR